MTVPKKHLTHPNYRADIDGLRAIAVLSVVLFHLFPDLFNGGFIGVDIFFVISGFLISGIIFSNLERNSFSLIDFYRRRVNRIFPALLLVLIACLVIAWFVLLSEEYKTLSMHIVAGATFLSNLILWREGGYFDTASELKPLLHLWSLAVEEQFYIIWPLLMVFVWKLKWSFVAVVTTIAALSFAINIYTISTDPGAAFFLPFPRFWELMIGSLLAYMALHKPHLNNRHHNVQSIFGLALLILGFIFISNASSFPGWWALLPTVGTFFIISAGPKAWFNYHVLSNKLFVWFGLISYPLYLWHWPLLSFATIQEGETPSISIRIAIGLISIALAWLTFILIEKPIRFGKSPGAKSIILIVMMLAVGGTSYFVFKQNGFAESAAFKRAQYAEQDRFLDYFNNSKPDMKYSTSVDMPKKFRFECDFYNQEAVRLGRHTLVPISKLEESCYVRDKSYSHAVLLWGDSHSQQLSSGLKNNMPANWQILQTSSSGCKPDVTVTEPSATSYCQHSNWFALKTIKETKPDTVVIAKNVGQSLEYFEEVALKLKHLGVKKVVFMGPTPHWTSDLPKIIVRKLWNDIPRRTYDGVEPDILEKNAMLQQNFKKSDSQAYVNIIDLFCNSEGCLTYLGEDKKHGLTSYDVGHLSPIASDYLAKNLLVNIIIEPTANF